MTTYGSWAGLLVFILLTVIFRSEEIAQHWKVYLTMTLTGAACIGLIIYRINNTKS